MLKFRTALLLAAAAAGLTACGSKEEGGKKGQVVATVNGEELTIHQLNARLQNLQLPPGVDPKAVQKQALDTLIDEEILVQKAKKANLDRDPQILQRLDQARRQVLAQAYMQREVGQPAAPSAAEIRKFYDDNPGLFSQRRRYALVEVAARPASSAAAESYRALWNAKDTTLDALMAKLKSDKVQGAAGTSVRSAEDLPLQIVPVFAKMKVGDKAFYQTGPIEHFIQVRNIQDSPIAFEQAQPRIEAFIKQSAQAKSVQDKLAELKKGAKIVYKSGYEAPAPAPAAVPAPAEAPTVANDNSALQRGAKGLH